MSIMTTRTITGTIMTMAIRTTTITRMTTIMTTIMATRRTPGAMPTRRSRAS